MMKLFAEIALALFMTATVAYAAELDVKINARTASVTVQTAKGPVEIMRNQDPNATIDAKYAKTSRKCPAVLHSADAGSARCNDGWRNRIAGVRKERR